jgi:hypothetical protein
MGQLHMLGYMLLRSCLEHTKSSYSYVFTYKIKPIPVKFLYDSFEILVF